MMSVLELLQALPQATLHVPPGYDVAASKALRIQAVATDSRSVQTGDLFVALQGERFDAHDFLPAVAASEAVAAIVSALPVPLCLPCLYVPNTLQALQDCARAWRKRFDIPVIAVTGSNGKTTVKEMLASIFRAHCGDHYFATRGNLNNEIGVPLSVLQLRAHHQAAVFELGMNHPGEMAVLAGIAQATVALVNNAQREHQEFMKTVQDTALENGQALATLPAHGVAVFPADDACHTIWEQLSGEKKRARFMLSNESSALFFSPPSSAPHSVELLGSWDATSNQLSAIWQEQSFTVTLRTAGEHNARNALAAAAAALSAGVPISAVQQGLENFSPVKGRLVTHILSPHCTLIDDTYNANPDSVRAAIDVLKSHANAGSHTILILGDMGEVGDQGVAFHQEIGEYAATCGIAQLWACGTLMQATVEKFSTLQNIQQNTRHNATQSAQWFASKAELIATIKTALSLPKSTRAQVLGAHHTSIESETGKTIFLVKGSRFMRMEEVVQAIEQQFAKTIAPSVFEHAFASIPAFIPAVIPAVIPALVSHTEKS